MKHSILVNTPSWGDVYIASHEKSDVLEIFWRNELNSVQRQRAAAWLSEEGWYEYAAGFIMYDPGLFEAIQHQFM